LFICGDTHGNTEWWARYLLPNAERVHADEIIQVGDFGFWEHDKFGVAYLDDLNELAAARDLIIYALHGNHDNWSLVMAKYGDQRDEDGFVIVRSHIRYIPQGHIWTWAGLRMRAFGGAYSIDKDWRLRSEAKKNRAAHARAQGRAERGLPAEEIPDFTGTLWFPDEEPTGKEFAQLMIDDSDPVDVVFSHDKPRRSNPMMNLKNIPECHPNQNRLQAALDVLRPRWWFHGHLHHLYTDTVPCGAHTGHHTSVVGLSCDDQAGGTAFWRPTDTWCVLDSRDGAPPTVAFPPDMRPHSRHKEDGQW
jgi:hypothetical protein